MKAHQVTTSETEAVAPGNYDFIHIQNVSDTTVYVKYDGSTTAVTTALGFPIIAGATLMLNNDGLRQLFRKGLKCIHGGVGNKEIRIQGGGLMSSVLILPSSGSSVPAGVITQWSGSIASIPSGWALCNGANGTPDLRDKFIVGAGTTYAVAATGGAVQHLHSINDPGHAHTLLPNYVNGDDAPASAIDAQAPTSPTDTVGTGITINNASSLPPYYALAYIMKL